MNLTYFRPEIRGNVEKKQESSQHQICRQSIRHLSENSNICKATTVTHIKRIYRNLLRKETSFVYYTSSVLRKSRHMKQKEKITHCC